MSPRILPSRVCLIVLFVLLPCMLLGAEVEARIVSGIVRDASTLELLPTVNIRVIGSTRGATTNREGTFRIEVPAGFERLVFSCIGYRSDTVTVLSGSGNQADISLNPTILPIDEVTVVAEGSSPAESIIRKAIRKKRESEFDLNAYAFKAYTKTTLRLPRDEDGTKDTVIAGLFETQTEGYWERPNRYKEVITARRQSANISPAQNVFGMGRLPNLNDNRIVVGQLSVVGPTSPDALDYYEFEMVDTLAIDRTRIFRLRLTPRSSSRPLFAGTISIADGSYRVMQVDVGGNDALDVPPHEKLHIRQRFSLYEDRYWLPIESSTDFCVHLSIPSLPPILWKQSSLVSDYEIGQSAQAAIFDEHLISTLPVADMQDSSRWTSCAVLPLTLEEQSAYRKLDSVMSNAGLFARSAVFLARLPVTLHGLPLTDFSSFFHFNRIEGTYLGAGADFSRYLPLTDASLAGGYGVADRRWKYGARVEQFFSPSRKFSFGADVHRTMRYREGEDIFSRGTITLLALVDKNDPVDYFLGEGYSVFTSVKPMEDLKFGIAYLDEFQASVQKRSDFSILRPGNAYRQNPSIADGRYRTMTAGVTYDTRKFVDAGLAEVLDESQDATLLSASAEFSGEGILKSSSRYQRYYLECRRYIHGPGSGRLSAAVSLGLSGGDLPPQRQFDVQAQSGGLSPAGAFRGAMTKEFAGARIATLQLEYNFGVAPLRALGISFLRNLELSIYSGTAWCDRNRDFSPVRVAPMQQEGGPYQEAGFGIGRILTFFKIDFTWRLTKRGAENFTVSLGSSLF